ncbi:hypothetical protein G3R49_04735 [Shewanella sp. WXL01]|uniref:hypothetical protein n=1 Tax=Shewanella sp. WXL01 TaxID=2709721 RepID=UPI0014383151|nr:hypothetical protein [Shewanella sp. WXL01]NKF49876.1 hypothetical protein [Shewanella sp. WXL01]
MLFFNRQFMLFVLCLCILPAQAFGQVMIPVEAINVTPDYSFANQNDEFRTCHMEPAPVCDTKPDFMPLAVWFVLMPLLPLMVRLLHVGLELPKLPRPRRC